MPRLRQANFDHLGHGNASIQVAAGDLVLGRPSHDDPFQRHVGAATARPAWRHLQDRGDVCRFTKSDFRDAKSRGGYFTLPMQKTGTLAHCFLGEEAIHVLDRYLKERADSSPWIFVQHGRSGKVRPGTPQFFRSTVRGYGSKISTKTAWEIVRGIGLQAYGRQTTQFISPHAFRHWHAQSLIRAGARLEDVQSVLGHANPVITKQIYAPEPDLSRISEKERIIQKIRTKKKSPTEN
jgi:integrase